LEFLSLELGLAPGMEPEMEPGMEPEMELGLAPGMEPELELVLEPVPAQHRHQQPSLLPIQALMVLRLVSSLFVPPSSF
jgi:hypothetical protein